eukprot:CAMPEP_0185752724 /NCGR_PEP_ID=MMETSP1174-20130828/11510_1 /TAXON_ID=35687 /ORGANISM="Dictyocha speculum, Strain CCMP1381" /LENGTH=60 /DNA_ID=CAMNT_0028430285 /DNA_START=261 /DNA_END=443 /DNA_ORIENTATION=-
MKRQQQRAAEAKRNAEVAKAVADAKAATTASSDDNNLGDDAELFEFYAGSSDGTASNFLK